MQCTSLETQSPGGRRRRRTNNTAGMSDPLQSFLKEEAGEAGSRKEALTPAKSLPLTLLPGAFIPEASPSTAASEEASEEAPTSSSPTNPNPTRRRGSDFYEQHQKQSRRLLEERMRFHQRQVSATDERHGGGHSERGQEGIEEAEQRERTERLRKVGCSSFPVKMSEQKKVSEESLGVLRSASEDLPEDPDRIEVVAEEDGGGGEHPGVARLLSSSSSGSSSQLPIPNGGRKRSSNRTSVGSLASSVEQNPFIASLMGDEHLRHRKVSSEEQARRKVSETPSQDAFKEEVEMEVLGSGGIVADDKLPPKPVYLGTPKSKPKAATASSSQLKGLSMHQSIHVKQQRVGDSNAGSKVFDNYKAVISERAATNESVAEQLSVAASQLPPQRKDLLSPLHHPHPRQFQRRRSWNDKMDGRPHRVMSREPSPSPPHSRDEAAHAPRGPFSRRSRARATWSAGKKPSDYGRWQHRTTQTTASLEEGGGGSPPTAEQHHEGIRASLKKPFSKFGRLLVGKT